MRLNLSIRITKLVLGALLVTWPALASVRTNSAELELGERLFREDRFSQLFFESSPADVNRLLGRGEPALERIRREDGTTIPHPLAGQAMSCASCHMIHEAYGIAGLGTRAGADFYSRSPIPDRSRSGDFQRFTLRNSQQLHGAFIKRNTPFLLHWDGEFTRTEDLVLAGLTGRNLGWLKEENALARAHIARVVREDNGQGRLASRYDNRRYSDALRAAYPKEARELQDDEKVLALVSRAMSAYLHSLDFSRDEQGEYNGSPYDVFLRKNQLPRSPLQGESDLSYGRRLLRLLESLEAPVYVDSTDGRFETHDQEFVFGPEELQGLKAFLREPEDVTLDRKNGVFVGAGNCIACHAPPHFTDFLPRNNGAAQDEYELIHGRETFMMLRIPELTERNADLARYQREYRAVPARENTQLTDLGLWNLFATPDFSLSMAPLREWICRSSQVTAPCSDELALRHSVALFKTPSLRNLGHSGPYMHTGHLSTLQEVMIFYIRMPGQMRSRSAVNLDPAMRGIMMFPAELRSIETFMRALNEDPRRDRSR